MKQEYIFKRKQRTEPMVVALLAIPVLLEAYYSATTWNLLRPVAYVHLVGAALFVVITALFSQFTITVTEEELIFGFWFIRKRVKLADIRAVSITEASLLTTGIGIHIVAGGYWAWTARSGPAVRVTLGARTPTGGYILSTDHPLDLSDALRRE